MLTPAHSLKRLATPVDGAFLAVFRICTGASFFFCFLSSLQNGWVERFYVHPQFHLKYYGFFWVEPLPGEWMRPFFYGLLVASAAVTVGFFYRVASVLLAIGYTYVFLLDKSLYQNHYYLLVLTSWMLTVLPAGRLLSIDSLFSRTVVRAVPAWQLWLVRFQVGLPYFFGGVAKVNTDWIHGQPIRMKLANSTWYPVIGGFFTEEWCVQIFVWGGMLFDLLVVPFLLWKPTRVYAYLTALCFHLLNATLFNIGVFPWFMIFATTVFFDPSWSRILSLKRAAVVPPSEHLPLHGRSFIPWLAGTYVVVQVLLPWRHYLYEGNVNWTEKGHYFAWHMKLRDKKSICKFRWRDRSSNRAGEVNILDYITPEQASHATADPEMIVQLGRLLSSKLQSEQHGNYEVFALNITSLNGRKPEPIVNPNLNLAAVPATFFLPSSVYTPLTEPLRPMKPWRVPRLQWTDHLEIPDREFWLGPQNGPAARNHQTRTALALPGEHNEVSIAVRNPASSSSLIAEADERQATGRRSP